MKIICFLRSGSKLVAGAQLVLELIQSVINVDMKTLSEGIGWIPRGVEWGY